MNTLIKIINHPIVELARCTENPEELLADTYGICRLKDPNFDRVNKCMELGHTSGLEHVHFTFKITCSRVCWSQMQEYRTANHTAQSHRVQYDNWTVVLPNTSDVDLYNKTFLMIESNFQNYTEIIRCGESADFARRVLPMCTAIQVIYTMDLRNILHFIKQRNTNEADWEIREIAQKMLEYVKERLPNFNIEEAFRWS